MVAVSEKNFSHGSFSRFVLSPLLSGCPVSSDRRTTSHCFAIESHSSTGQSKK